MRYLSKEKLYEKIKEAMEKDRQLYEVFIELKTAEFVVASDPQDAIIIIKDYIEEILDNARYTNNLIIKPVTVTEPKKIPKEWNGAVCWSSPEDDIDYEINQVMLFLEEKHQEKLDAEEYNKKQIKLEL